MKRAPIDELRNQLAPPDRACRVANAGTALGPAAVVLPRHAVMHGTEPPGLTRIPAQMALGEKARRRFAFHDDPP
jgi:hypothetical protein